MITYGILYKIIILIIYFIPVILLIRHKANPIRIAGMILLCFYTIVLIGVVIFPIYVENLFHQPQPLLYNIIPFHSILGTFKHASLGTAIKQTFGNILLFMPLGFLLPFTFRKFRKFKNCFLMTLCVSVSIELIQLFMCILTKNTARYADIDDVILNTIGGMIGYGIYVLVKKYIFTKEILQKYLSEIKEQI